MAIYNTLSFKRAEWMGVLTGLTAGAATGG